MKLFVASLAALIAPGLCAQALKNIAGSNQQLPGGYIFEFDNVNTKTAFLSSIAGLADVHMDMSYGLFNGLSIQMRDTSASNTALVKLRSMPGVVNMWPIVAMTAPGAESQESEASKPNKREATASAAASASASTDADSDKKPAVYNPHVMTQVDKLHAKGLKGKGEKIAIIDTGIDYTHPALGGCFGKGCHVVGGYDLVGDAFSTSKPPKPDNDPMDQNGFGTRMAGVVAAQKNRIQGFIGVAPDAKLLAYKITGNLRESRSDIVLAALHRAYDDGATIIICSYSVLGGWPEIATAAAASQIVAKGVPVIAASGETINTAKLLEIGDIASGKGVTAVTSFDNNQKYKFLFGSSFTVDNQTKVTSFNYGLSQSALDFTRGDPIQLPLYATTLQPDIYDDACNPLPNSTPDLADKFVLIREGGCFFRQKVENCYRKNAKYFIIAQTRDGPIASDDDTGYVNAIVTKDIGQKWVDLLKAGKDVTVRIESPRTANVSLDPSPNDQTGGSAIGGSWGPTVELDLKPQFGAPGGWIVSTTPGGQYSILFDHYYSEGFVGQAASYAAGVFALVRQATGIKNPRRIENMLSSTAKAQAFLDFYNSTQPFLALVPQQGAGLIQAYDAIFSKLAVEPTSISFNDSDHTVTKTKITLTNKGSKPVTYKLGTVSTKSVYVVFEDEPNVPYPPPFPDATSSLTFGQSEVKLGPGESKDVSIRASEGKFDKRYRLPVWSGWITINGTDSSSATVPYIGMAGSLHKTPIYAANETIVIQQRRTVFKENDTISFPNDSHYKYYVRWSSQLPSPKVELDLLSADTGALIGAMPGYPAKFTPIGGDDYPFLNATTADGKVVPAGRYKFRVRSLRVFGREDKKEDWDILYGYPFYIAYDTDTSNYR